MSTESAARPVKFADYRLTRFLGEGNESRVFAAKPPARLAVGSDLVSLKIQREITERERFHAAVTELQCVRRVQSPAIVTLYEAGWGRDGTTYWSMEFACGGSLAGPTRHLRREDVYEAVARAARGAHALHEAGVVHRAIRPGNIVLTEGGAKLTEPNLSHLLWPGRTFHALYVPANVQYIDPALVRADAPSRATDIWALGATLHVALTGKPIYYHLGSDLLGALRTMLTGAATIDGSLMPDDAELIRACLAPDPGDRPASALEVAEWIERILGLEDGANDGEDDRTAEAQAAPAVKSPEGFETLSLWTADSPSGRDVVTHALRRPQDPPTVEGIACKRGHLNYPGASYCVSCGVSLLQGSRRLVRLPRPALGVLILDDGAVCTLDADYVIGCEPSRDPTVRDGKARPLRLDDRVQGVSAIHADIHLDGWRVLLGDRGSTNGTFIRSTGTEEWVRLVAGQPVELRSRTVVRIGEREFVFTSNRER